MKHELLVFAEEWRSAPLRVGAIAPSGRHLAALMTCRLDGDAAPVIELGPGTGVFTRTLIASGIPEDKIALVEKGLHFAASLEAAFPGSRLMVGDAARVAHLTPFGPEGAGTVLCGLPLLSMPPRAVFRIVHGAFAALRPKGFMRAFTYGPRCPIDARILCRLDLVAHRLGSTARNLPPAAVYEIRRRSEA